MPRSKPRKYSPAYTEALKERQKELREPEKPIEKRYVANSTTIQKLLELQSSKENSVLLLFRDELVGFISSLDTKGQEEARATFLELFKSLGPVRVDRIGRGSSVAERAAIAILGGIQTEKLEKLLKDCKQQLSDDGFFQRFQLLVFPESKPFVLTDGKPNEAARDRISEIFRVIDEADFSTDHGIAISSEGLPFIRFSLEAQSIFDEYVTELMDSRVPKLTEHADSLLASHLTKFQGLFPSLALIVELVAWADSGTSHGPYIVSKKSAEYARDWCEYLELHARKIYALAGEGQQQALGMKQLAGKLRKKEIGSPFTVRDVYRKGWSYIPDRETAEAACKSLEELNWLCRETVSPGENQKSCTRFHVHPAVLNAKK